MDVVRLPVYLESDRTPITAALATLRQKSCGALLIRSAETAKLVFAGDLLRARARGIINVQSVAESQTVAILTSEEATEAGVDFRKPHDFWQPIETMLEARKAGYALPPGRLALDSGLATVITRSETLGAALRMAGGYECNGEPRHYFPEPRVEAGAQCPEYPLCSRADNEIPTVHPAL